jgi:hypothetical protein
MAPAVLVQRNCCLSERRRGPSRVAFAMRAAHPLHGASGSGGTQARSGAIGAFRDRFPHVLGESRVPCLCARFFSIRVSLDLAGSNQWSPGAAIPRSCSQPHNSTATPAPSMPSSYSRLISTRVLVLAR